MDKKIRRLKSTTFCGHRFTRQQLWEMQQTVLNCPRLSRTELARTVCEHLGWSDDPSKPKYPTCLRVLEQLAALGVLELPDKRPRKGGARKPPELTARCEPQAEIEVALEELMPLRLRLVTEPEQVKEWNEWVQRYHYLGYKHPIGKSLRYFIEDSQARILGCISFGFATKILPCRDEWIGWQHLKYKKNLKLVVNQNRFLILPWVNVKNLASKALSLACRQLPDDWQREHGCRPLLAETFVDESRFSASCYRAANWQRLGTTAKRSGKTQKGVYAYALDADAKTKLLGQSAGGKSSKLRKINEQDLTADDQFESMWRHLIDDFGEVATQFDEQWQLRKRLIDTKLVMLFVFLLVLSNNRRGYGSTLALFWQQCRQLGIALRQRKPPAASAMCVARRKVDEVVFKQLHQRILLCARQQPVELWCGLQLYAIDGSKVNLPRALVDCGYRTPNSNAHYPQGLLSCLYDTESRMPIDFALESHENERKAAMQHLKVLGAGDVVVYDRGYYSFEMVYEHRRHKVDAIFRMKYKSAKLIDEFIDSDETEKIVEVMPSADARRRILARDLKAKLEPMRLRLIKYMINDEVYTLATTLLDEERFPSEEFCDIYHGRWAIEELYNISKELLTIEQFHAKSERGVKQELYAHFVLIAWARLFTNYAEAQLQAMSKSDPSTRFQLNFKHALAVLRQQFEVLLLKSKRKLKSLLETMLRCMARCRQRLRFGRSSPRVSKRPRKKGYDRSKEPAADYG